MEKKDQKTLISVIVVVCIVVGVILALHLSKKAPEEKPDPELIATVGPNQIRVEQFKQEAQRRGGYHPDRLNKEALLNEMIDYETLIVKAIEAGLDKDPEIIRSYRNLLVGKYKQRNLTPQIESVTISDEDIQKHYEANIEKYTKPAKIRMAMLFMKTHPTMSEEKIQSIREQMAEARTKALELSDERGFGTLSINYSEDQTTRYKGGDIGWIDEGRQYRWEKPVLDAGFALENIGDISELITTENGIYLVKLLDRSDKTVTPLEKLTERIRHKMLLDTRKETEKTFQEKMRASVPITIYKDVLETVQIESGKAGPDDMRPPKLP